MRKKQGPKILVIPDTQCKPGVPLDHLDWAANYIRDKRPDYVVHLGDHWDMPSLSSYDRGKLAGEGARFRYDIQAGNEGLRRLSAGFNTKTYNPKRYMLRGNHEQRIERATNDEAWLDGTLDYSLFNDKALGWTPVPFLQVLRLHGVHFAHYFPRSSNGRVVQTVRGAPSAREQARRECASATAGHQQGLDVATIPTGDGTIRGIICGSFYRHEESYMGPQGDNYWRGIIMKHEVVDGDYNLCEVSMNFLRRKYG